jgi:hypothetical protein
MSTPTHYPTDLSDNQWERINPPIAVAQEWGGPARQTGERFAPGHRRHPVRDQDGLPVAYAS